VLVLSDTTSLNLGNSGGGGGIRTVYDQFFLLFASLEPTRSSAMRWCAATCSSWACRRMRRWLEAF
jgi:hypothetical protein